MLRSVGADGGDAAVGDREGRQLERVAAHVQRRELLQLADRLGQARQLVGAHVQRRELLQAADRLREARQLVVNHVQLHELLQAAPRPAPITPPSRSCMRF